MATSRTFASKRAQDARRLYDEGHGCNAIAKQFGVSPSTISAWAKREGLAFDRSQTALAIRAHTVDLAEMRVHLAQKMAGAASDMLDRLNGEYPVFSFGVKDNDYNEHTLERPPVEVVRNAVTTAGTVRQRYPNSPTSLGWIGWIGSESVAVAFTSVPSL